MKYFLALSLLGIGAVSAAADIPEIVSASAEKTGMHWRFEVTLKHPDTGWDHFAAGWDVVAPDGTVLGERELMHPHVQEQPFTRSLSAVSVPDGMRTVFIRTKCLIEGWSGPMYELVLSPGG